MERVVSLRAEADLARLEQRSFQLEAELIEVRAEIERIKVFLDLSRRYGEPARDQEAVDGQSNLEDRPPDQIPEELLVLGADELIELCRGKSIPDAAISLIRLVGRPLSEEEMVGALKKGGITFVSDKPALTLRFALLKKRKEAGIVELTEAGLWNAETTSQPAVNNSGFVLNRGTSDHAERSRRGLLAAKERGVVNGRRSKITPELRELAIKLLASGAKKVEIARQIGITPISLNRWIEKGYLDTHGKEVISSNG